ncbi:TPA: M56 family metallopeptidase, partial [Streptococcus suis]
SNKVQIKENYVNESIKNKIFIDSHIDSPILINIFHPIILIPNISYSDRELKYIILHEKQHIKNKDLLLKLFLEILIAIYWWFPPIYFLKNQMNFLIELKVDNQVSNYLTDSEQLDYLETLISVKKKSEKRKQNLYFELSRQFTYKDKLLLTKRLKIFFDNSSVKKRRWALFPVIFILILIPFIVFEPYQVDKITEKSTINPDTLEESFIIETIEGNYILYEDNKKIGSIKDPNESPFDELKIYKEGESK